MPPSYDEATIQYVEATPYQGGDPASGEYARLEQLETRAAHDHHRAMWQSTAVPSPETAKFVPLVVLESPDEGEMDIEPFNNIGGGCGADQHATEFPPLLATFKSTVNCWQCSVMETHDTCPSSTQGTFMCSCFSQEHPLVAIEQLLGGLHLEELQSLGILTAPVQGKPILGFPFPHIATVHLTMGKRTHAIYPLPYGGIFMAGPSDSFELPPFPHFPASPEQLPTMVLFPNNFVPAVSFTDGRMTHDIATWLTCVGYNSDDYTYSISKRVLLLMYEAARKRLRVDLSAYQQWWLCHHHSLNAAERAARQTEQQERFEQILEESE